MGVGMSTMHILAYPFFGKWVVQAHTSPETDSMGHAVPGHLVFRTVVDSSSPLMDDICALDAVSEATIEWSAAEAERRLRAGMGTAAAPWE